MKVLMYGAEIAKVFFGDLLAILDEKVPILP